MYFSTEPRSGLCPDDGVRLTRRSHFGWFIVMAISLGVLQQTGTTMVCCGVLELGTVPTDFSLRPAVALVQSGSRHELQKENFLDHFIQYHASMTGTKEVSSKTPCKEFGGPSYSTPERVVAQTPG
jgi:hypothetical protein